VNGLELRELVKHYAVADETVRAVDGVSLTIEPGEFVAIYGPSGSGKTTLLMLIAAIMRPDRGGVWFDGREVTALRENEADEYRLRDVGFVFQSFALMGGASALDNAAVNLIAQGLSMAEAREYARPWLEQVGLGNRLNRRPGQLSTGERQRVAFARALANGPRVLLADEPTGNLDTGRSREMLTLMRTLAKDRSMPVVLATHDPQAADYADRVYTLRDGRLAHGRFADELAVDNAVH
jgi:putative ABC transport system ATP-binding protein